MSISATFIVSTPLFPNINSVNVNKTECTNVYIDVILAKIELSRCKKKGISLVVRIRDSSTQGLWIE